MSRRRRDGEPDPSFEDLVGDVAPLPGRDKLQPPPTRSPRRPAAEPAAPPPRFDVVRDADRCEGIAVGIDRRHLRRLRRGEVPVEVRIDLHGHDLASARERVRRELLAAAEAGLRGVLVIHGKGRRSAAEPVLKQALPEWLTTPPLAARVLAFATAAPAAGGSGATAVLLRRQRGGNAG